MTRGAGAQGTQPTSRSPSESVTSITQVMEIAHSNNQGNVHGGAIMRLVDTAAGIAAARHCRTRVVTAVMDEMSFLTPVLIGDLLTVEATVTDANRTSMEIAVRVEVETIPSGERRVVSRAHLVFVALDGEGKPTSVPSVRAETEEEKKQQTEARIRRDYRLARRSAIQHGRGEA